MLQRATLPPEGGIPAYYTDAWSLGGGTYQAVQAALLAHERETGKRDFGLEPRQASPLPLKRRGLRRAKDRFCHATEILLVLAPLTCPQEPLQTSPQKLLAEDSLSCSEATGDCILDAIRRST